MIPKIIHYIWLGNKPIPKLIEENNQVIGPEWEVKIWTDKDFTFNECQFVKEARDLGLHMYCSDALRFLIIKKYGGVYLDADVRLHKTPDALLDLPYAWGNEYWVEKSPNTGILLAEPNNPLINMCWDYYCKLPLLVEGKYTERYDTDRMRELIKGKSIFVANSIEEYKDALSKFEVCIFDNDGWENYNKSKDYSFAAHEHSKLWGGCSSGHNVEVKPTSGEVKIFLCAHKPIDNYIPKDKRYVILDVTGRADNSFNGNFHQVIDISNDPFTKSHNVCYGEGCAMRWLYNHPDMIPEYICFGHYRRMFLDCIGFEYMIPTHINTHGAIVKTPFSHKTNEHAMYLDHPKDDTDAFIRSVKEAAPEYWESFKGLLNDHNQYPCNIFAMKKEDFLEMCEMCFKVLDHFDEIQGYTNNSDVFRKIQKLGHRQHLRFGLAWQVRLQGFWLEWLTDLYYRHKYGIDNCLKLEAWFPNASDYEKHPNYR